MRIAFIGQKGIPAKQGGIEKHVEELSTRLAASGLDITVYSRSHYTGTSGKKYQNRGVNIINLPSFNTKNFDAITHTFISSLHAIFGRYDIIHYHGVGPSLMSWIPRILSPRSKVIVTFHCIDRNHQKWSSFAKLMLTAGEWTSCRFPHETIVVSKALQKYCQDKFNCPATYIPNGVSFNDFATEEKFLAQYNLTRGNYLIAVSRLIRHKGIHTLIEAYQKINTDKPLVIVGDGANTDDYVNYLKTLATDNKKIIFTGQKSGTELLTLFKNAYLFIQPSEAEGLSIALLEAMGYGVPVLVSDIEENLEAVGDWGLNFQNKNQLDLAKQLDYAVSNYPLIQKKAEVAKRHVNREYNWQDIVGKTIALYQENNGSEKQGNKVIDFNLIK